MDGYSLSEFDAEHSIKQSVIPPTSQCAVVRSNRQKTIFDPIWGEMHLDPLLMAVVDTSYFQRLRHLKQLGTTYFVFPGASHNRFEHSLGTAHLASQMVRNIMARQPDLGLVDRDVILVSLAGLCHDLGHGAFSHVFDNELLPAVADQYPELKGWTHEQASEMMLDAALKAARFDPESDNEDRLSATEVKFVKELINPPKDPKDYVFGTRKAFLYEIVSNPRNSIDVDKFDYLNRDAYTCGVKINVDVRRLMTNCRVLNNQICYHEKVVFTVYQLFHSRYTMFKQVYSHRAVKAVEYMVRDALISANSTLKFVDRVRTADDYLFLDDRILALIQANPSEDLNYARALLRRIDLRDIYRFTEEALIPESAHETHKKITAAQVLKYLPDGADVAESDVIVQNLMLNFAKKDKNPVDDVLFFKNWDDDEPYHINRGQASHLMPSLFLERYLRVFVKTKDDGKIAAVREAITNFVEAEFNTPLPRPAHGEFALTQERLKSPSRGSAPLSRSSSAHFNSAAARKRIAEAAEDADATNRGGIRSVRKTVSFSQAFSSQQSSQETGGHEVKRSRSSVTIADDEDKDAADDADLVVDTVRVIPPSSQNSGHGFSSSQRSRGTTQNAPAKKDGQQSSLRGFFTRQ